MKILITGVAGFIGSNLAEYLLERNHEVYGIDNLSYGVFEQIPAGVNFTEIDIRSKDLREVVVGMDAVFHFAAKNCISDCQANPLETADINILGTLNIFESCRGNGVKRIIYAESSAIYEGSNLYPTPESDEHPVSFYAASKMSEKYFAKSYSKFFGLQLTALRYFNVYGPKQDYRRTIPPLMSAIIINLLLGNDVTIYGNGEKRRDFIYINDINQFHELIINNPSTYNQVYNLGCGVNYLKELSISHNYKIILVIISNELSIPNFDWLYRIVIMRQPSKLSQIYCIICNSIIKRKVPFQSCFYWSRILDNKVNRIIEDEKPVLTIFELIRTILYSKNIKTPKLLDLADLLSRRYLQQFIGNNQLLSVAGQYEKHHSKFIRSIFNYPSIKNYILKQEFLLMRKCERETTNLFDLVSLVSLKEIRIITKYTSKNNYVWIPNGVDIPLNCSARSINTCNKLISFVGVLDNPHNEQAVLYFIKDIFPYIIRIIPDIQFHIIGRNPTCNITKVAKKFKNHIHVFGDVINVEELLKDSMVTVVPLLIGSGVKTKIFESLKLGVPVVSTSIGAEGLVDEAYKCILVRDNPKSFADACISLIDDANYNLSIGNLGISIVDKYYSWKYVGEMLNQNIIKLQRLNRDE